MFVISHTRTMPSISNRMIATYTCNGNMITRTVNGVTYAQAFDIENRLTSVTVNGQTTAFHYDADGNRTLTVQPNGTKVYTPFPDYEETVPATGGVTKRVTFSLAGQPIAVRVITDTTNNYYYAYADHLGSISAWTNASGALVSGSLARYEPYGGYRTKPASTVNPGISDRGFTGHRQNNTGGYDMGLIYMNARYYLPEVGRFISADTIVPEPKNPQTYNRYSYALNSPVNFTDPTGHCTSNYEAGSQDLQTCLDGWNAVVNYLYGAAFGPGGSGNFPNETVSDWLANADIGTLENLMQSYGIDYGYLYTPPVDYSGLTPRKIGSRGEICQYWQSCYDPVAEYSAIGGNLPLILPVGPTFIWNQWGNIYFSITAAPTRGVGIYAGNVKIKDEGEWKNIEDLAVDRQEKAVEDFLTGWGDGGCAATGVGGCLAGNSTGNYALQMGFATPGASPYLGYTWLIYDK